MAAVNWRLRNNRNAGWTFLFGEFEGFVHFAQGIRLAHQFFKRKPPLNLRQEISAVSRSSGS